MLYIIYHILVQCIGKMIVSYRLCVLEGKRTEKAKIIVACLQSAFPTGCGDSTVRQRFSHHAVQHSDGHIHWYDRLTIGVSKFYVG